MLFSFIELLPKAINKAYVLLQKVVKQHFNLKLYKKYKTVFKFCKKKTSDPQKIVNILI